MCVCVCVCLSLSTRSKDGYIVCVRCKVFQDIFTLVLGQGQAGIGVLSEHAQRSGFYAASVGCRAEGGRHVAATDYVM